ncbi:Inositolphosphorylceramide synthase subunit Kei1-domain-containing protein [Leucosporidium creatinivorum]|uniref:Inositolphosphorylceramide synthase subunit Kei1-domain-containing protein n=1 Tax=Leucosporidium creatinivorum TaxID=106004 RepID=A0A1Y2C4K5_9BASI|nr:Inositolphosphorylceramide synthase subunit Kei1-domain-containing protein [Leucosporidium creatinivorum]
MQIRFKTPPLLTNFLGLDLKLGVSIVSLFGVLNKVAGAYGMMAVLTGGTLAQPVSQLTMYIYSIATLVVFLWGLKKISEENGPKTLIYAHLFAVDHFVGTIYTAIFAVMWYVHTPHDGRRVANSDAQKEMMGSIDGTMGGLTDEQRALAAQGVWKSERGFSAAVLILGWFIKIYFILCLYSFAIHLRRNSYHTLPKTRPRGSSFINSYAYQQQLAQRGSVSGPNHTRHSSTGGPRYTHIRGASVATDAGTDTTLAETLWEDEDQVHMGNLGNGGPGKPADDEDPPFSPAVAKGTGMVRSLSGGVMQRSDSGSAMGGNSPAQVQENNFTRILNKV